MADDLKPWERLSAQAPTGQSIADLDIEVPGFNFVTASATNAVGSPDQTAAPWEVLSSEAAARAADRDRTRRTRSGPPSLGGTDPTLDYHLRGPTIGTSARNIALGTPVLRSFVSSTPEVEAYQRDFPSIAGPQRTGSSIAPFMALGMGAPGQFLFGGLGRAATTGGAVGGADAGTEAVMSGATPSEVAARTGVGTAVGAASALPAALLGRLVTPRTPHGRNAVGKQAFDDAMNYVFERPPTNLNVSIPRLGDVWSPVLSSGQTAINPTAANVLTALAGGTMMGQHPLLSLGVGLSPTALRFARLAERRGALANEFPGYGTYSPIPITPRISGPEQLFARYTMNSALSEEMRALLNALAMGATYGTAEPTLTDTANTLTGR